METHGVYFEVRTEFVNNILDELPLQRVKSNKAL
jgi:hypothetical protein